MPGVAEAADGRRTATADLARCLVCYLMWTPEMARLMTRRWISDVPSKIV